MKYEDIDWENLNNYKKILDLPEEVWKPCDMINNYFEDDIFFVSNYGRCRHMGKWSEYHKVLLKPLVYMITDNGNGYKKVAIHHKGLTKNFYVHRIVASTFLDNYDNLPQVNHKPSGLGKFDNRVEHLEWSSESHNIKDAHKNGQMKNRTEVYTKVDIKSDSFIRELYIRYLETGKISETAREFGIPRTTLSSIINKRSRRNITDPLDLEYKSQTVET